MRGFISLIAIIGVLFVSCTPSITEGTVYAKEFSPAHTVVESRTAQTFTSKGVLISIVPVSVYYPDSWYISYKIFDEKSKKYRTNTILVSEEDFDSIDIGSWYISKNY